MSKAFAILRRNRRFTLLMVMAALLVVGFLATRPPSALAATLRPQTCTYYNNAAHSQVVGWYSFNCNGTVSSGSGTMTIYKVCEYDYCCGNVWC